MNESIAKAQRILDDCFTHHQSRFHDRGLPCDLHFRCACIALGWREESNAERRAVWQRGGQLVVRRTSDAMELGASIAQWKFALALVPA